TYFENIDFIGKAITVASNFLIDADTLHIENTIINGRQPTNPDFGSVVTFVSNEDTTSVITGFTLTEGTGTADPLHYGGGIYCTGSSPKIVSNIITNNSAEYGGGVDCSFSSNAIMLNNVISYNTATENMGGLTIFANSNAYVEGNIISNNTAILVGGVLIQTSSPTFVNNIICNNAAETYIGGLDVVNSPGTDRTTIENCQIYGNTAGNTSGGLQLWGANVDVINCTIYDNHAGTVGGGVFIYENSVVKLSYTSIIGNSASTYGGGIHIYNSEQTVTNCTMYGNEASYGGGISNWSDSNSNLVNCILWNDTPQEIYISTGSVTATYSDIQGGWAGEGNIDEDPLFIDPANGDFHLTEFSP
ncbi:MAG: right-handed parallel beta-helix repeat-containing protein, partial [Candidatus Delongbacteria bacterium]|nr:right-handed parallel beta-helix repeat-containing protein [Candidatus Delongbacteria bacterium]